MRRVRASLPLLLLLIGPDLPARSGGADAAQTPAPTQAQAPARSAADPRLKLNWNTGSDDPVFLWYRHDDAGWRALDRREFRTAEHEFTAAINVNKTTPNAIQTKNLAQTYSGLALALHFQGRNEAALPLARWALEVREREPATAGSAAVAASLSNTAAIERALSHPAEAESLIRRALAIHDRTDPVDSVEVANLLTSLAQILNDQRRFAEAESMAETAASLRGAMFGPTHDDTLAAVAALGLARFAQGKDDAALADLRRVIVGLESQRKPAPPAALLAVADIQGRRGQSAEAEAGYRKAVAQLEAGPGPAAPATVQARRRFAAWLDRVGRPDEARRLTTTPTPAPAPAATPTRPGPV